MGRGERDGRGRREWRKEEGGVVSTYSVKAQKSIPMLLTNHPRQQSSS